MRTPHTNTPPTTLYNPHLKASALALALALTLELAPTQSHTIAAHLARRTMLRGRGNTRVIVRGSLLLLLLLLLCVCGGEGHDGGEGSYCLWC